ncbi:MAG: GMC family oxidoreductase, partial [Algiphilus sp.]
MRTTTQETDTVHSGWQPEGMPSLGDAPSYDYVVIGGGSAGCIAAARLAEAGAGQVVLVEAGDAAQMHPETLSADGFKDCFANDRLMRHRMSAPQPHCGKRSLYMGSGWVLGGSGAVNGMVYTRGDRRDFDAWPEGWRWQDLQPTFEAVEVRLGIRTRPPTPFLEGFLEAAQAAGFARKDGMNDGTLSEVVGCNAMNTDGDTRRSAYRAWLHENPPQALTVQTNTRALRLLINAHGRAQGVELKRDGVVECVAVRREVILCGGALESPKLLQLSGVGPRALLDALKIPVRVDAPSVGAHLQDHPNVCVFFRGKAPVDFHYPQVYAFGRAEGPAPDAAPDTCFV